MNKYFMATQNENVLDILIYGDITSWDWYESDVSSYTLAKLIQESNADRINVRINSYGGEVAEGLAIYNALKNHSAEVMTVCDGFACSAASVVFMAGNKRVMNDASLLMIHNAWTYASGNAKELRKAAEDLEKISTAAANAYRAVMSISDGELDELLDNETWITPDEALEYGFATEIKGTECDNPQYSVRNKVFEQLAGKKTEGSSAKQPEPAKPAADEPTAFQKLFEKFTDKKGEKE